MLDKNAVGKSVNEKTVYRFHGSDHFSDLSKKPLTSKPFFGVLKDFRREHFLIVLAQDLSLKTDFS